jgi:hypothetical protein
MPTALHAGSAALLFSFHLLFLLRGVALAGSGKPPRRIDRIARAGAQILLPVAVLTGLPLLSGRGFGAHCLLGLSPLIAIPAVNGARILLRRRKAWPWLLPVLNMALITAAGLSGLLLAGGARFSGG